MNPWRDVSWQPGSQAIQTVCGDGDRPYGGFNLGIHVGDDPAMVASNRAQLASVFGASIRFPTQVHGTACHEVMVGEATDTVQADALVTRALHIPIGILTADCLPVLFASSAQVGCAHAGWRGLVGGVLESTLDRFQDASDISCWLGPCIGARAFEVGPEVKAQFLDRDARWESFFTASERSGHALCDLKGIASDVLRRAGVRVMDSPEACTLTETQWYSYRRDGVTGRMASCIMRTE